jgi:hypothetical protein
LLAAGLLLFGHVLAPACPDVPEGCLTSVLYAGCEAVAAGVGPGRPSVRWPPAEVKALNSVSEGEMKKANEKGILTKARDFLFAF